MSENGVWASSALRRGRFGKAGLQACDNAEACSDGNGCPSQPSKSFYAGKSVGSQGGLIRRSTRVRFPLPLLFFRRVPLSGWQLVLKTRVGIVSQGFDSSTLCQQGAVTGQACRTCLLNSGIVGMAIGVQVFTVPPVFRVCAEVRESDRFVKPGPLG